ncbi:Fic family protein [Candidatus Venteria ishoeyi]|uniref:Protein adenylyltransferase n=1 Tax=Candidatus Venteria ishoeyi TaxID=1899563 RepID=A0A1H6F9A4_9GAMM|nr:Fic family protein [Candidatus Venteria ishoeyi]MDM8545174.1 Fic family protein [Candidatus Venteria ishoeyi]SEH06692.1 Adenosine monophosphate-protein transferase SoFic [Candidatus Venteria ishoeyi]
MSDWQPAALPPALELETKAVLKQAALAHRYLAELKGVGATIPNETILINTLTLQEARDSSAVENIITTQDALFRAELQTEVFANTATKEVQNYANALRTGFELVRHGKILTLNHIKQIQSELEGNNAGFRRQAGTALKNQRTGETVYTPPQHPDDINRLMDNLEQYINNDELSDVDPLIKMAVIHHQFESIHPFYDGNGRTGRIINVLYLVCKDLLQLPILYLSRYVIENKDDYYQYLQQVRDANDWESWVLFMLKGIADTAQKTIHLVHDIKQLMQDYKHRIRAELPKVYSQDLLNNLFKHPYTKIEFVMDDLRVSRATATSYLDKLVEAGFLEKLKIGRSNYYLNKPLYKIFIR